MFFVPVLIAGIASAITTITSIGATDIVAVGVAVAAYNLTKNGDDSDSKD